MHQEGLYHPVMKLSMKDEDQMAALDVLCEN